MSDATVEPALEVEREPLPPAATAPERAPMPRWKKLLLAGAAALFLLGLLLRLMGGPEPEPAAGPAPAPLAGGAAGLVEQGTGTEPAPPPSSGGSAWSPGLMALGFSFFVGFAVGHVMRAFLKLALLFFGLLFLTLAGLAQLELLTVHWDAMDGIFQNFAGRVGKDFEQLQTIVTGRLPQAGLGALGLFAGFKRR